MPVASPQPRSCTAYGGICCPQCLSADWMPIDESGGGDALDCAHCGATYPVLGGVPVLFADAVTESVVRPGPDVVRQILQAFRLPDDIIAIERLRQVCATRARYGDALIGTEAGQFLDRVRSSGHAIAPEAAAEPIPAPEVPGGQPACRWTVDHLPRLLPAAQEVSGNIRFENTGTGPMRAAGDGRVTICVGWSQDGADIPNPDTRTPLPLDVPPGGALTLPVKLLAPARPGRYQMRLTMVQEGVRWLHDQAHAITVTVRPDAVPMPPPDWVLRDGEPPEYEADHAASRDLLRRWLLEHAPAPSRVLEVGGNAYPMIAEMPGEHYNVDVDLLGLQIGRLVTEYRHLGMRHLCADAENLPFAEASLDAIVMFATLHHFAHPARLLAHLRRKLAPGGFIGVLCEPVGHIWPGAVDPAFLAELRKGVNEQSFSLPEYDRIFRQAGLRAASVQVDGGSLKARLVPA